MRSSNALAPPNSNLTNGKVSESEETKTINQALPGSVGAGKYEVFYCIYISCYSLFVACYLGNSVEEEFYFIYLQAIHINKSLVYIFSLDS